MNKITKNNIKSLYFEWLTKLVSTDNQPKELSYRKLFHYLFNTDFTYIIERDSNRANDGYDFRYRFGYLNNISVEEINNIFKNKPCSMLEMMISLSYKIEESIMDDPDVGNRTGQWFWNMIVNLGLGHMFDSKFNKDYCDKIIAKFLNREYEPNGKGGLFTIYSPDNHYDLRTVEIWYQAMWYLDDNYDFSI